MNHWKKYCRLILNIVIPLLVIWLVCFIGPRLLKFFLPFVIGWIIAMIANPLVKFLEKRVKIVRKHSSMMIVVAVLALIITLLYFVISKLVSETVGFVGDIPKYYESASIEVQKMLLSVERASAVPATGRFGFCKPVLRTYRRVFESGSAEDRKPYGNGCRQCGKEHSRGAGVYHRHDLLVLLIHCEPG